MVDSDGKIVPTGTVGELYTRGHSIMLGYWNDDSRTEEVIGQDRWYKTG